MKQEYTEFSRRQLLALLGSAGAGLVAGCQSVPVAADAGVEAASFRSRDGALIAGDIHLPGGRPTHGIVLVHGSGPEPRMTGFANDLATDGFAVLTYDKRGVGKSGGTYEGTYNISWDNLHLLGDDAAAAARALANHPRMRGRSVGFFGISQGGWIAPLAAVQYRRTAWMVFWSGPVCSVSDELLFGVASLENAAAEDAARVREGSPAQMIEFTKQYAAQIRANGMDVDTRDSLRKLDIPGLWLFGGKDNEIPTELSKRQLAELVAAGKRNYEQRTLPGAEHAMRNAHREAFPITRDWIRAHG
jgi:pimeloyl-ACP methyl ester carboxylesterase